MKHTPGPWGITEAGGIAGSGEAIIINDMDTLTEYGGKPVNNGFGRAGANARLIAAAPELLDCLCAAQNVVKGLIMAIENGSAENLDGKEWLPFQRQFVAVIEKATGGAK